MTVFLIQALETALTSNLSLKTLSEPRLAILHVVVGAGVRTLGHDKEGRNAMISCQQSNTKKRHKTDFATTKLFSSHSRLHVTEGGLAGSLPLGGDRRYFNGNNFNSTSDPVFVVMTSHWPSHTTQGLALSHHRLSPSCDTVSVSEVSLTICDYVAPFSWL